MRSLIPLRIVRGGQPDESGGSSLKRSIIVSLVVLATLAVAAPASAATPTVAYLDPATGTLIVSAIIGGFAAIGMFIKKFWYQIKGVFTGGSSSPAPTQPADGSAEPATDSPAVPE